jgi:GGDEF domain-containing protein
MCRVIADAIVSLGFIPIVLMATSAGPHTMTKQAVSLGIALCCLAMGWMWSRGYWPTRFQSQACIVICSVCIALACLIEEHALVGVLGATGLTLLSAFAMLYHSGRMLAVPWTVGGAVAVLMVARLPAGDTALAICAVSSLVLVNVVVALGCRTVIQLIDIEPHHRAIEPLTGLPTREAFDDQVGTLLGARSRSDDRYLVVIMIGLDSLCPLSGALNGATTRKRARVAIARRLREILRHGAVLAHVGETEYVIADLFTAPNPEPLTDRVHAAVTSAPLALTASIGAVCTPLSPLSDQPVPDVVEELLTIATSAMRAARRAGGSQTHLRLAPRLRVLERPQPDAFDEESH